MRIKDFGRASKRLYSEALHRGSMSRKRQYSDSNNLSGSMEPNDRGRDRREIFSDPYCWICHQSSADLPCTTCYRSYHSQCIGLNDDDERPVCCEVCTKLASLNARKVNENPKLDGLLNHVIKRLDEDKYLKQFGSSFFNIREPVNKGPLIVNRYDLSVVQEKVQNSNYKSTLEFLNDIRLIRHNAEILFGKNDERVRLARDMERFCDLEMYDIEMCSDCFDRSNTMANWFTEVCNPPHLLIWAKMHGYPYWPAKVIGVVGRRFANIRIDVRFFGEHNRANVSPANCKLFWDNPNTNLTENDHQALATSLKEVDKYIKNIEDKYKCRVSKAAAGGRFNVASIRKHLMDMIPGLNLANDFELPNDPIHLKRPQMKRRKSSITINPVCGIPRTKILQCTIRLDRCDFLLPKYNRSTDTNSPSEPTLPMDNGNNDLPPVVVNLVSDESDDEVVDKQKTPSIENYAISSDENEPLPAIGTGLSGPASAETAPAQNQNQIEISAYFVEPAKKTYANYRRNKSVDERKLAKPRTTEGFSAPNGHGSLVGQPVVISNGAGMKAADENGTTTNNCSENMAGYINARRKTMPFVRKRTAIDSARNESDENATMNLEAKHTTSLNADRLDSSTSTQFIEVPEMLSQSNSEVMIDLCFKKAGQIALDVVKRQNYQIKSLEGQLKNSHEEVTRLKQSLRQKTTRTQDELEALKQTYEIRLKKSIEEIKRKKWCSNCQAEAVYINMDPPVCSERCLQILWELAKKTPSNLNDKDTIGGQSMVLTQEQPEVDDLDCSKLKDF